jgi:hypothetical protein
MTDNRSESERRYDEIRLSRQPIEPAADQGPFGTDVTDELIATFERLEAAHGEATPQQILAMAQPPTPMNIDAMYHETIRRLSDPTREPFVLATHPLAPEKVAETQALFRMLSDERQDRLLTIFEQIVSMPEPEMARAFDFVLAALEVVEEYA